MWKYWNWKGGIIILYPRYRTHTRYTVHGRGAKHGSVEHIISVWIHSRPVSNGDSFQSVFSRMPSLSHQKIISEHFFFVTPPTSVQNSAIFAPFTKGKSHMTTFRTFFQNCTFFRLKKGPRTGLSHSLTHLTAIQFSDHAKSMAQITERIFNEAHSRCRSQKSIIIRTNERSRRRNAHQFFFTTGWIERFAQQVVN